MLNKSIRILNFDESLIKQERLRQLYHTEIIDFSDLGPSVRLWMGKKKRRQIQERLATLEKGPVVFLGSGDFHHIADILTGQVSEPFNLIVFDFHPDWDTMPPRFGCGSWVAQALRNQNIQKCLLIGVSSEDISTWNIQSGDLAALKNNRLEIYPYSHKPTSVFCERVPANNSIQLKKIFCGNRIYWGQLKDKNLSEFFPQLIKSLPAKKTYISLDKDCLKKDYAVTNWEEGFLSLDELLLALGAIKDNTDIIGMDITGDYSPVTIASKFKAFLSRLDHPRDIFAKGLPEAEISRVNSETNLKILQALIGP